MQKIKFSVYFVFISAFTFITLFILIVQNSYTNLVKPTSQINSLKLTPIDPNLDLSVISQIEKREDFGADNSSLILISTNSALPSTITSTATPKQ